MRLLNHGNTIDRWLFSLTLLCLLSAGDVLNAQLTQQQIRELIPTVQHYELAVVLAGQGKYDEAVDHMKIVVDTTRRVLGPEHGSVAGKCRDMAAILHQALRPKEALPYYRECLRLNEPVLGPDHPTVAATNQAYAECLLAAGNVLAAERVIQQALQSGERAFGSNTIQYSRFLNAAGFIYMHSDRLDVAEECYRQSLAIRVAHRSCPIVLLATARNNLGDLLVKKGDYARARIELDAALSLLRQLDGDHDLKIADTINNIGFLLNRQGDYGGAVAMYRESLKLVHSRLLSSHPTIGRIKNNLGAVLLKQDQYGEAIKHLADALTIMMTSTGRNSPKTCATLSLLGQCYFDAGNYRRARDVASRVLNNRVHSIGLYHRNTGYSMFSVGLASAFLGEDEKADHYFSNALTVLDRSLGRDHISLTTILVSIGCVNAMRNRNRQALEKFDRAYRIASKHARSVLWALPQNEQATYVRKNAVLLHRGLSFAVRARRDSSVVNESAEWLANGKAISHDAFALQTQLQFLADNDNDVAKQLVNVRQKLATLAMTKSGTAQQHKQHLDELTAQERALSRRLAAESVTQLLDHAWYSLEEIRRHIAETAVVVDFIRATPSEIDGDRRQFRVDPERYYAWTIPGATDKEVSLVDLGSAEEIDDLISDVLVHLKRDSQPQSIVRQGGEETATEAVNQKLRALARRIYDPLGVEASTELTLCPDGNLWLVPWAALPISDQNELLIEQTAIHFLNSSRQLVASATTGEQRTANPVIVADPDFDLPWQPGYQLDQNEQRSAFHTQKSGLTRILGRVDRLAETGDEARQIKSRIQSLVGAEPKLLLRGEATESFVKQVRRPSVLVFSTHGFFLPEPETKSAPDQELTPSDTQVVDSSDSQSVLAANPFLRCGLLLAGCNKTVDRTTEGDDGILTGSEILGLDLRGTRLVVLGACDTGTGQVQNGEGVAGLRQAFRLAGARHVLATLWSVDSADTRTLTESIFHHMASGLTPAKALRSAQLERIEERRFLHGAAHPYYWAGLTVTGN